MLKINTLVLHKRFPQLGIGCIVKVLKKKVHVNFGMEEKAVKMDQGDLVSIDTSGCRIITPNEYRRISMGGGGQDNTIIIGNALHQYVGIGWVALRVVTHNDLKKYPRLAEAPSP